MFILNMKIKFHIPKNFLFSWLTFFLDFQTEEAIIFVVTVVVVKRSSVKPFIQKSRDCASNKEIQISARFSIKF